MENQSRSKRRQEETKKIKRKQKKADKKARRKSRHIIVRILFGTFRWLGRGLVLGIILAFIGISVFWSKKGEEISNYITEGYEISETIDKAHFAKVEPTVLLDGNGKQLREFKERNYHYISLAEDDELFQKVSDVVVSIEDERFYQHKGFDYYGVGIAVINYIRGGDLRGASTITQQLVKNTYLTQEQTMGRKVTEAVIAQELEKALTKREILEYYVNDNYYSQGQYGLATAALYYYSKNVSELSAGELAVLTGIPNNPTLYDPITNPENALHKRNVILAKMLELGKLTQAEYDSEKAKPIELKITKTAVDNSVTDYGESFAIHNAIEEVMKVNGFPFKYWFETNEERDEYKTAYYDQYEMTRQDIMRGGYVIETSIQPEMQKTLQKAVDNALAGYTATNPETGLYKKQAASTIIDNQTHEVVAIVGGRSQEGNSYNRAYLSARQPGSSIKPFLSYATAFEKGLATETTRQDKAIKNGPKNWYSGYRGSMTLRYALEQSVNTVAYRLMAEVGTEYAINKLADMEFQSLHPSDNNAIVSVGGFTQGATTVEMANALHTLTNDGQFLQPTNVRKIISTKTGTTLYERSEEEPKEVYQSGVGYVTLDAMKSVTKNGSGKKSDWGYPHLATKTGTTDLAKDLWLIGATPYYSASVFVGNDTPAEQDTATLNLVVAKIFKSSMGALHEGKKVIDFVKPASVVSSGKNLWVSPKQENHQQDKRLSNEASRIQTVKANLQKHLAGQDYRLVHGLSYDEEMKRERVADAKITLLEQFTLSEPSDMKQVDDYYQEAKESVKSVKRSVAFKELDARLKTAYANKSAEKHDLEAQIKYEKQLKEQKRAEKERQEQREQQELEELLERQKNEEQSLNEQVESSISTENNEEPVESEVKDITEPLTDTVPPDSITELESEPIMESEESASSTERE